MLSWLRARDPQAATAAKLYGSIVAQARKPAFYAGWSVPDTMEGRFEMIVLHLALVLERLRGGGTAAEGLARALTERFVTDVDDTLREIGISDLGVPKRVKKAAGALYDRVVEYRGLLAQGDTAALAAALDTHVFRSMPGGEAVRLARYVRTSEGRLAALALDRLLAGDVTFGDANGGDGDD